MALVGSGVPGSETLVVGEALGWLDDAGPAGPTALCRKTPTIAAIPTRRPPTAEIQAVGDRAPSSPPLVSSCVGTTEGDSSRGWICLAWDLVPAYSGPRWRPGLGAMRRRVRRGPPAARGPGGGGPPGCAAVAPGRSAGLKAPRPLTWSRSASPDPDAYPGAPNHQTTRAEQRSPTLLTHQARTGMTCDDVSAWRDLNLRPLDPQVSAPGSLPFTPVRRRRSPAWAYSCGRRRTGAIAA